MRELRYSGGSHEGPNGEGGRGPSPKLYRRSAISGSPDIRRRVNWVAMVDRTPQHALHPLHAFLLAATTTSFLGALLCDVAYGASYQIQWTNFASWTIALGLVAGGGVLAWALADLLRADLRQGRPLFYFLLVLASWVLGLVNALIHAKDAWATMPEGLVLSVIVSVLACAATWMGFSSLRPGGRS